MNINIKYLMSGCNNLHEVIEMLTWIENKGLQEVYRTITKEFAEIWLPINANEVIEEDILSRKSVLSVLEKGTNTCYYFEKLDLENYKIMLTKLMDLMDFMAIPKDGGQFNELVTFLTTIQAVDPEFEDSDFIVLFHAMHDYIKKGEGSLSRHELLILYYMSQYLIQIIDKKRDGFLNEK